MNKSILPLLVLVLIAVALGVIFQPESKSTDTHSGYMFERLQQQGSDVDRVIVKNAQGVLLDAKYVEGQWLAENYQNYPVDTEKLADLMGNLVQAKKAEPKTRKQENYARLGVEDLKSENSQSTQLDVLIKSELVAQLLVGRTSSSGGSYVRVVEQEQSWLLSNPLSVPVNDADWLLQPILNIALDDVQTVSSLGDNEWTISKSDEGSESFILQNIPEGRALKYDTVLDSVVSSLITLNFDALTEINEEQWSKSLVQSRFVITLKDDSLVNMELRGLENKFYIRFFKDGSNDYWTQWQYVVTGFAVNQFNKSMDDLLAEPKSDLDISEQEILH